MDLNKELEANQLANKLIEEYKKAFLNGLVGNYFLQPLKYIPSDTWVSKEWWISMAEGFVKEEKYILIGLEILLNQRRFEYLDKATQVIEKWWREKAGHDPEYYLDIISHLPKDHSIRQYYIDYNSISNIDTDDGFNRLLRNALIRVEDTKVCNFLSERISSILSESFVDEGLFEDYVMPRMVELGSVCSKYIDEKLINKAKDLCRMFLERDQKTIGIEEKLVRSLWIRCDITHWAWTLGWHDILNELREMTWYWDTLFNKHFYDWENYTLLVWSQRFSDEVLRNEALKVMKMADNRKFDGAIAWTRMEKLESQ